MTKFKPNCEIPEHEKDCYCNEVKGNKYAQRNFDSLETGVVQTNGISRKEAEWSYGENGDVFRCNLRDGINEKCYITHSASCIQGLPGYTHHNKEVRQETDDCLTTNKCKEKCSAFMKKMKKLCTKKTLKKRIPIMNWLPKYTLSAGISDFIAGVTVGLTVIPQAIAYASVAGLPPQYGLYSSFMACFVYTIFGSCKDSPIGPTAIAAILTKENLHDYGPQFAILLCFLSGCVELVMGLAQLGFLTDFIGGPVSVGFTSAAAIIIATTQVKAILGLNFPGGKFLQVFEGLIEHGHEIRLWDTVLGISCIIILLILRKIKDVPIKVDNEKGPTAVQRTFSKLLWFISTSRNILVVVICGGIAYYFEMFHKTPFILTGHVKAGLPEFAPPMFEVTTGNVTYEFKDMVSVMGSALVVVPLLSILENNAIAQVFSEGQPVDTTQEMIAIGLCNIASSFVGSMPVSGALSRGAVNHASGVKTTFGGVYTGILVLVSLQYFTPYFYYIPKASLAAVIIAAVVFMVEFHVIRPIWRTKKIDIFPALATFLVCLFVRLEVGILAGFAINFLILMYRNARPRLYIEKIVSHPSKIEYLLVRPDRILAFPSVEFFKNKVNKAGIKRANSTLPVVLDGTHIQATDFTIAMGIKSLIDAYNARGQPLIFYNLKPSIYTIFTGVKPSNIQKCDCLTDLDRMLQDAANTSKSKISILSTVS